MRVVFECCIAEFDILLLEIGEGVIICAIFSVVLTMAIQLVVGGQLKAGFAWSLPSILPTYVQG